MQDRYVLLAARVLGRLNWPETDFLEADYQRQTFRFTWNHYCRIEDERLEVGEVSVLIEHGTIAEIDIRGRADMRQKLFDRADSLVSAIEQELD